METLIEQSVCLNNRCYGCGALVYDIEKKKTTNHVYHNRCFCCRICKRNLTASTLNEEGDDIYCTNCYRKKQRGDCNSLDFQRAASERADYIYNHRHPDQPSPQVSPRRPINQNLSRHPSWTLRQLERQFLSMQPTKTSFFEKTNDKYSKGSSLPQPLTLKTSFSTPVTLSKFPQHLTLTANEPSPLLHFSPVFSPYPEARTPSNLTPKQFNEKFINSEQVKSRHSSIDSIRSRINQSNTELTDGIASSPATKRKPRVVFDMKDNKEKNEGIFRFPDFSSKPTYRRSASVSTAVNRRKIK